MMKRSFGDAVTRIIKTDSIATLIQEKRQYFIDLIITLGTRTAEFVNRALYVDKPALDNIDPNLSIMHIAGLADYITKDTILDVKVLNHIDEKCVRQVLGYHYLSTKRDDVSINKLIVYDATSDRSVEINISPENIVKTRTANDGKDKVSELS